jgi:hypothetical protein
LRGSGHEASASWLACEAARLLRMWSRSCCVDMLDELDMPRERPVRAVPRETLERPVDAGFSCRLGDSEDAPSASSRRSWLLGVAAHGLGRGEGRGDCFARSPPGSSLRGDTASCPTPTPGGSESPDVAGRCETSGISAGFPSIGCSLGGGGRQAWSD